MGAEMSGAFEHDIHREMPPGQLLGMRLRQQRDALPADPQHLAVGAGVEHDLARKAAVRAVIAQQMRQRLGVTEVVDGNDAQRMPLAGLDQRAQHMPADAAEAVDGDAQAHAGRLRDGRLRPVP